VLAWSTGAEAPNEDLITSTAVAAQKQGGPRREEAEERDEAVLKRQREQATGLPPTEREIAKRRNLPRRDREAQRAEPVS
jgi:hypothetical protein